jgi:hypothetical protein
VLVDGERVALRLACAQLPDWPVGRISGVHAGASGTGANGTGASGPAEVDDLFALDLAAVGDTATARRGSLGRAVLVASLQRLAAGSDHAGQLSELLGRPVRCLLTEPAAARLGALTTPGARPDAAVVDVGAGTIDVIAPGGDATGPGAEVVAAGAGELLTAAVAETLGIPRAEDGGRGFLDRPAPASAAGTLAVMGPAGLLPFDRRHSPAEWRAVRLRLKQAVFAVNLRRALATLGADLGQVLIVGGPAGDDEMLGVLLRSLPGAVAVGRGNVGGTLAGSPAGHRYAAALGLALAGNG